MHEPEAKFNAACYFKKALYDDMEWQQRHGVSIQQCFEVISLGVCNDVVIYELWWFPLHTLKLS